MAERDLMIEELWSRLTSVPGVKYTARNPSSPPSSSQMPAIQLFEFPDTVEEASQRGSYPAYKRKISVAVEAFITATSEETATREILAFAKEVKKKVYAGGNNLGRTCSSIVEEEASRILRPAAGENIVGIGIVFQIRYIEDVSKIM